MGVSGGDSDLNLLVAGGQGFVDRVAELRTATEAYTKALGDLNLGRDAMAAKDEAARILSATNDQCKARLDAVEKEVADARERLGRWESEIKAKNMADHTEAQQALADAKAQQAAAVAAHKAAQESLAAAKRETAALVEEAYAASADIIDNAKKEANIIVLNAKNIKEEARKSLFEANEIKDKYQAAIERIKSAMV